MDRSSGSYRGDDGGLYKGGELGSGLHMMGQKEKEVSRMTPRFLSCNTVWLSYSVSSGAQRGPGLGRTGCHFAQWCPEELYNMGVLERITVSVSDKLSLRCL